MQRKESRPLTKRTLNLFEDQMYKLQELHPRLGAAKVIRTLVDDHIRAVEEGVARKMDETPVQINAKIEEILP